MERNSKSLKIASIVILSINMLILLAFTLFYVFVIRDFPRIFDLLGTKLPIITKVTFLSHYIFLALALILIVKEKLKNKLVTLMINIGAFVILWVGVLPFLLWGMLSPIQNINEIVAGHRMPNGDFLNNLKGQIVYLHRDKGISNVYKISANGKNKQLLYHHNYEVNNNCLFPRWSKDGSKIYFSAMKDRDWKTFVMDSDGSNVKVVDNEMPQLLSSGSREDDIVVERGSIYYIDDKSKKTGVYRFTGYDSKFRRGASEASWSPDKQYIIFQSSPSGSILVANREGKVVEISKGRSPDWKY